MAHAAHIAHHSPGRLRIRVPAAKGNPEALAEIRQALSKIDGVSEVLVNEIIGTVTIHYDPKHHSSFDQHLANGNATQDQVRLMTPPKVKNLQDIDEVMDEAAFLAQHSHTAKILFDWAAGLDNGIKRATDNAVDLKVIVPLALAVGIFLELGLAASTPVWLTLGLFSFNHFVDLHSRHPVDGTENPVETQSAAARPPVKRTSKRYFP